MLRARWRRPIGGLCTLLAVAGCRHEKASVEELYTTRMLGIGYLQRNQLAQAETAFRKLTRIAPDDPLGYADLGLTYLQAGQYKDAEQQLKRARELDPGSSEIGLALAKLYSLTGRQADARVLLDHLHRDTTSSAHVLYALAQLEAPPRDSVSEARYEQRLRDVLSVAPANLVARLDLARAYLDRGAADSTVKQLEEVRRIPPELPERARVYLDSTIQSLRITRLDAARATFGRLVEVLQTTAPYQASLDNVKWADGPIAGRPVLTFAPKYFVSLHGVREHATVDSARFVDATSDAGLPAEGAAGAGGATGGAAAALAVGDVDGDGADDLLASASAPSSGVRLYRVQGGFVRDVTDRSGIVLPGGATFATFADVDNDGWLDLFAIGRDGRGYLFRNRGNGSFEDVSAKAGIADLKGAHKAIFVDLDHDGDLDLLLVGGGAPLVYRNNLDGTFTDVTTAFGLSGVSGTRDAVFGDFDGDGRIDLAIATDHGPVLLHNGGAQHFSDVTSSAGLTGTAPAGAIAEGDYNNDGALDLFVAGVTGGESVLWLNNGDGTFRRDKGSSGVLGALRALDAESAIFLDYDNDGYLDLLVAGAPAKQEGGSRGIRLFRNDGSGHFLDRSSVIPATVTTGRALAVTDIDQDGDEDVLITDAAGAPRLLRNDGGNANLAVNVSLEALRTGSGKNNDFGIGARLELRAGEIYQARVATDRVTHFGLGRHLKADVLRVEWPNGVPQTVYLPGSDQDVVETEMLKGSCALAYTWDGKRFRFVTDAMWRSALGMPLGLMGSTGAFAPAGASQEYVRIAGDALAPRDGKYVLQLTEELWETAYADEVKLVAVDHPDSIDVFVDERFVPPGPVKLRIFQAGARQTPLSAVDERGNDVLPALRAHDDLYVSNMTPTRYQGVVEPHEVVLDLGPKAGQPGTYLFLRGWIYPTDASINVALGQQSALRPTPPSLEVRDARGHWSAVEDIGFPSGKDKTIALDLAGKLPTSDHRVRIRTNMQIYWDEAFVATDNAASPVKLTTLAPISADLHYRGFSRMYRKGGRYGPYWFDYDQVSKDSPWRPIAGAFTRFGDVLPLFRKADDMYVIMGPGDEATLKFDASSADSLPRGWKRDFLLYTDGWIKDSDLNTAYGTSVGPLPFHSIKSYPYTPGESYPADAAHDRYLREYDTRVVRRGSVRP